MGSKLVDAKGVSKLYQPKVSNRQAILFALVGIASVLIALAVTPAGQTFYGVIGLYLSRLWATITGATGFGPIYPFT